MSLRFKLDENLPGEAADLLRGAGHDVRTVLDQAMSGTDDSTLAAACAAEDRVMLTLDGGFADIRLYPPAGHAGIIVLRLTRQSKSHIVSVIARLISTLAAEAPRGQLWIVEDATVRIRL